MASQGVVEKGLKKDALGVLLLHEPRRPGLRDDVLVGDARHGPWAGWIGGWAIVVADIIVMANLA